METGPYEYRDQIENWVESVCEITFGSTSPDESESPET